MFWSQAEVLQSSAASAWRTWQQHGPNHAPTLSWSLKSSQEEEPRTLKTDSKGAHANSLFKTRTRTSGTPLELDPLHREAAVALVVVSKVSIKPNQRDATLIIYLHLSLPWRLKREWMNVNLDTRIQGWASVSLAVKLKASNYALHLKWRIPADAHLLSWTARTLGLLAGWHRKQVIRRHVGLRPAHSCCCRVTGSMSSAGFHSAPTDSEWLPGTGQSIYVFYWNNGTLLSTL